MPKANQAASRAVSMADHCRPTYFLVTILVLASTRQVIVQASTTQVSCHLVPAAVRAAFNVSYRCACQLTLPSE